MPDKLAIGVAFVLDNAVSIENEIPHITLLKGTWPAKHSNTLLKALFSQTQGLHHSFYQNLQSNHSAGPVCFKTNINVGLDKTYEEDDEEEVFVVRIQPEIELPSVMHKFYSWSEIQSWMNS